MVTHLRQAVSADEVLGECLDQIRPALPVPRRRDHGVVAEHRLAGVPGQIAWHERELDDGPQAESEQLVVDAIDAGEVVDHAVADLAVNAEIGVRSAGHREDITATVIKRLEGAVGPAGPMHQVPGRRGHPVPVQSDQAPARCGPQARRGTELGRQRPAHGVGAPADSVCPVPAGGLGAAGCLHPALLSSSASKSSGASLIRFINVPGQLRSSPSWPRSRNSGRISPLRWRLSVLAQRSGSAFRLSVPAQRSGSAFRLSVPAQRSGATESRSACRYRTSTWPTRSVLQRCRPAAHRSGQQRSAEWPTGAGISWVAPSSSNCDYKA